MKTIKQKSRVIPTYRLFSKTGMFQDYKSCSFCGQNEIPFKKGVCAKCSRQVGNTQYVKDPKEYVQSNYGDIKNRNHRSDQGLDEL
jgi:hypothetical protein